MGFLELKQRIEAAKAECEAAKEKLDIAQAALRDHCLAECGVAIGSIVKDKNGHLYKITKADVWSWQDTLDFSVSVHGVTKLKNGTFGNRSHYVGTDWTVEHETRVAS
jgi:hypothetical protein